MTVKNKKYIDSIFNYLALMAKQRHLIALRDGMIASIPVILVGSSFLLLGSQKDVMINYLPWLANSAFGKWYCENFTNILIPFRFTMGMLSLYVTFSVSASLAGQYKMPVLPQAMGSVIAFLLTLKLFSVPLPGSEKAVLVMPLSPLGGDGLFLAIICGLSTVEISRLVMKLWDKCFPAKKEIQEKSAEENAMEIPPAVSEAFISFVPLLIVTFLVWFITYTWNIDIYGGLTTLIKPLEKLGDTVWCVACVNFFMQIFGFAGLHGISVINGVFFALWQKFLLMNTEAHMLNPQVLLPTITAYPFYQWFVWIGGAGTTLPVPFMLLFFKNTHMKRIGKISLVPSLFNINEPLLFGLPIVANPILAIPFILSPIVCGVTAFSVFKLGLITRPFIEVPWVLPAFLGAPFCTQDAKSLLLLLLNCAISACIWFPFLKAYEKRLPK